MNPVNPIMFVLGLIAFLVLSSKKGQYDKESWDMGVWLGVSIGVMVNGLFDTLHDTWKNDVL